MEDEHGRHVAEQNQVMKDFAKDAPAQASAGTAYDSFKTKADGVEGVAVARLQNKLKYARQVDSSLSAGNTEASVAMNVPASTVFALPSAPMPGTSYNTVSTPSLDANTRVVQYTQRAKYVAGRAFFQNGNQWIDNNVSKQNGGKSVRLKFGSDDYFKLIAENPEARPWLALGQNVRLVLNGTVYDIYDDTATN